MRIIDRTQRQSRRANVHAILVGFTVIAALTAPLSPRAWAQSSIFVSNVLDLYNAVNDPANAGAKVVIAPGTYVLMHTFPNGGRLELQQGMSLIGQTSDPSSVVIDAVDLQSTTTGPIRMGRGSNAVEWLTIQNGVGTGLMETDLPPTSEPTHIRVAHVILQTGAARGIDFRIMGSAFNGKTIDGVFESNVIRNINRGSSEGMRAYLLQAVSATMNVTLRNNSFAGNQIGLLAANNSSSTSTITIDSAGDQFRDNRAGCWLIGGIGSTSAGNVLVFTARDDQFDENNRAQTTPQYKTGGGIVAMGAALQGHDNRTRLEVLDSHFSGNTIADISVYGYYDPLAGAPGIHNVLELRPSAITPTITPSDPPDPSNTNTVILLPPIPTLTVNSTYCTGSSWSLQVSKAAASSDIRLLGSSNGVTWEIPRWRTTEADGTFTETGTFADGTQGSHTLQLQIAGAFSRTISFVVSDCRP
jgi:hypothetical protein